MDLFATILGLPSAATELPEPLAFIPPVNPWAEKVEGDGRMEYVSEEMEELELRSALAPVEKLFASPAPERIAPNLGAMILPSEETDDEEKQFACPVAKLFAPDVHALAPAATSNHLKKSEWDQAISVPADKPASVAKRKPLDRVKYDKIIADNHAAYRAKLAARAVEESEHAFEN